MLRRTFEVARPWSAAVGLAMLVGSTLASITADRRAPLTEDALARSHGSNQGNGLTQSSCDTYNQNLPCQNEGDDCVVCLVAAYNSITGGGAQYYYAPQGGTQSCGSNWTGTCDADNFCDTSEGNKVGTCQTPPAVMMQAH
jgi:hypothetical protein